jgi:streptomycin 3"-adenylyltransferase
MRDDRAASRHLGISAATLQAIHVFGSAFDGESKPHGDIDLPVTIGASPRDAVRRAPMSDLLDVSPLPGGATRCAYRT